jgi:hypothetical protein
VNAQTAATISATCRTIAARNVASAHLLIRGLNMKHTHHMLIPLILCAWAAGLVAWQSPGSESIRSNGEA